MMTRTRTLAPLAFALAVALFSPPRAQAGTGTCTAGRGAVVDGGSCCSALGVSGGGCDCDESNASTTATVTCSHTTIKDGSAATVQRVLDTDQPVLATKQVRGAPERLFQVVGHQLEPARLQACLASSTSGATGGSADQLQGTGIPTYAPLSCETFAYEAGGSMEYAMRCFIEADLDPSSPVDVQVNLRVYDGGSSYWNSCSLGFPIAPSKADPGDAADAIASHIDGDCADIAASAADLGNGTALVDIWSTDSPIICVGDVPFFDEACDQLSSVLIAN